MKRQPYIVMIGPSGASKGGIATVVNNWREAGVFDRWPIEYLTTHVEGSPGYKLYVALDAFFTFFVYCLTGRVGLLHAHLSLRNGFWRKSLFLCIARLFRIPYIAQLHSGGFFDFYHHECRAWQRRMVTYFLDHAAEVVILTAAWRELLTPLTHNKRLSLIPNFIPVPDAIPTHAFNTERQTIRAFFLGRLTKEKGIYDLLHAFSQINRDRDVILTLAGDGLVEEIKQTAIELGIADRVNFCGWITGLEKRSRLVEADIFILPSYFEVMPMGLLEAMAHGTCVIATRVGGIPDIVIHLQDGWLISPGDRNTLACAIEALAANGAMRERFRQSAWRKVKENYSPGVVVPQIDRLYRKFDITPG